MAKKGTKKKKKHLDSCAVTMADNRKCVCMRLGSENSPLNDGCESLGAKHAFEAHTCQLWASDNGMESQHLKVIHVLSVVNRASGGECLPILSILHC